MYVLSKSTNQNNQQYSSTDYNNLSAGQLLANDVATIARSDRVASDVAKKVGLKSLSGYNVEVESSTTSRIITLSVTGTSPRRASDIANAYVRTTATTARRVMGQPAVNVVDTASVPTTPSGPRRTLYVAVAFLVGLLLAALIVVLADRLNTKVRGDEEAQRLTGLPIVAHFPKIRS
jgi:capsular polysaccharide biosynthesis protein